MKLSIHRLFVAALAGGFLSQVLALPVVDPPALSDFKKECDGISCSKRVPKYTLTAANPHHGAANCESLYCLGPALTPPTTSNLFRRAGIGGGKGGKGDDEHEGGSSGGKDGADSNDSTENSSNNGLGGEGTSGGMTEELSGTAPGGSGAESSASNTEFADVPGYKDEVFTQKDRDLAATALRQVKGSENPQEADPKFFHDSYNKALEQPGADRRTLDTWRQRASDNYIAKTGSYGEVPNDIEANAKEMGLNLKTMTRTEPVQYRFSSKTAPKRGETIGSYSHDQDGTTIIWDMHSSVDGNAEKVPQSELIFHSGITNGGNKFKSGDFIENGISNLGTRAMITRAQMDTKQPFGKMATFRKDGDEKERRWFEILMGTQNVKPVFFMLGDHRDYFNNKEIKAITTWAQHDDFMEGVGKPKYGGFYLGIVTK